MTTTIPRLVWLLALTLPLLQCTRQPKTQKEKVSYTIGAQFGKSLKAQNLDLDLKALQTGLEDGVTGARIRMSDEEMQAAVTRMNEEKRLETKAQADLNKSSTEDFLSTNKGQGGIVTTASGLQYKILKEGEGPNAKAEDTVVVNYKGTLLNGTEFDSSFKRGQPAEFPVKGVIPGWSEGLQLMKKGGKAVFYIPPELGYGAQGRASIPGNAVIIFEVEMLDIKSPVKK